MRGNREMIMIQSVDVSSGILYEYEKAQKEVIELSNACVSHEIRNPLNSICTINIAKKQLFK